MGIDLRDWSSLRDVAAGQGFEIPADAEQAHHLWLREKAELHRPLSVDLKLLSILTNLSRSAISNSLRGAFPHALERTTATRLRAFAETIGYHASPRLPREWEGREIAVAAELLSKPSFSYHEDILRSITRPLAATQGRITLYDVSDHETRFRFFWQPPNLSH